MGGRGRSFGRLAVQTNRREIKEELVKLEKRNAELAAEAARLESESGKEGGIRKRFDVAKPGEKILVIIDKNSEDVKINDADTKPVFSTVFGDG